MPQEFRFPGLNVSPRQEETFTPERAYPAAIQQQARDYDELMRRYRSALESGGPDTSGLTEQYKQLLGQQPTTYASYTPETQQFTPTTGIRDLQELARTGGLDEPGISALRARAISPIRSVYANAMRQMERQRVLQGGYSPNMPAAQARMSRELSEQLGGASTNVEAEIARMVQSGRLQAAPQLAGIREREAGREADISRANIAAQSRAEEFNRQMMAQMRGEGAQRQQFALQGMTGLEQLRTGREAELLGGMRSLYGTTPALTETFGRQAMQGEQLGMQAASSGLERVGSSARGKQSGLQKENPWHLG